MLEGLATITEVEAMSIDEVVEWNETADAWFDAKNPGEPDGA